MVWKALEEREGRCPKCGHGLPDPEVFHLQAEVSVQPWDEGMKRRKDRMRGKEKNWNWWRARHG